MSTPSASEDSSSRQIKRFPHFHVTYYTTHNKITAWRVRPIACSAPVKKPLYSVRPPTDGTVRTDGGGSSSELSSPELPKTVSSSSSIAPLSMPSGIATIVADTTGGGGVL